MKLRSASMGCIRRPVEWLNQWNLCGDDQAYGLTTIVESVGNIGGSFAVRIKKSIGYESPEIKYT
jgi:hypothetical protein